MHAPETVERLIPKVCVLACSDYATFSSLAAAHRQGMSTRQDGPHYQCAGSDHVQRGAAHTIIDQLRVNKKRFHLHGPQIRKFGWAADVHVPCRIPVSVRKNKSADGMLAIRALPSLRR